MSNLKRLSWLAGACLLATLPVSANPPRISAELEATQISVVNDVAEATFTVVVKNEEDTAIAQVWLVFADGYEIPVGDVAAESTTASESVTRTFDLSAHIRSLNVPFKATLKYNAGGTAVEHETTVVLRLGQPEASR